LPRSPFGRPLLRLISVQVSPPSVERNMPLPGPPETSSQGRRIASQNDAYRIRGLFGSIARSLAPAFSPRLSTRFQVFSPSRHRYTPRSGFAPCACPRAATYTVSASSGWTRTLAMLRVRSSPRCVHVFPASVVRYTPSPWETLPRMQLSPIPTYTTFGSDWATAIPPTDARLKNRSVVFSQ